MPRKSQLEIEDFIRRRLQEAARDKGLDGLPLEAGSNILELGILDSLGFVSLLGALEEEFNLVLDIGDRNPDAYTTLEGLIDMALAS